MHKCSGVDEIQAKVIKDAAEVISAPLCFIFNKSWQVGTFPDSWNTARVFPIHKGSAKMT